LARSSITAALLLVSVIFAATVAASAHASPSATAGCANLPHTDHPKTTLSNGALNAVLFLPDAANGYYRAARFDWAGVIGCVSLNGHTFFGEWFPHYDPLLNDSITGPVEEFRSPDTELGYTEAAAGGTFLKIGVGVLRKPKDAPYNFSTEYPIVDIGKRTTHVSKRSVTFTQRITTTFGYAYLYEKTVRLDEHAAILTLEHTLTNLGTKSIDSNVYDHDFFMLDNKPTGPGMVVRLGFPPVPDKPFPGTATISGNEIVFTQIPTRGNSPQGYLTGYTGQPNEYSITLEDRAAHLSVEQTSPSPIAKFYFWSTPVTICPEAYIHVSVAPGATQTWQIQYRFRAN
jgi:hypothetical protein